MSILEFMNESPVLTCFILMIVFEGVIETVKAYKNKGDE